MRTRRTILRLTLLAASMLALAGSSLASEDGGFKVIVNPENPVAVVERDFLRDAYLKKSTEWNGGETIRPIDLASRFPAHDRFTEHVIRKTPAQLRTYWNQQIFSGKGVPPPEAESVADVIAYVLAHKGAVGYLPTDVDPGRAKTIAIR
jgi:ABC-type phosphate transport system substrate-binding protein